MSARRKSHPTRDASTPSSSAFLRFCGKSADEANAPELRVVAANSLGRLRDPDALAIVSASMSDSDPAVARQARLTRTRLSHVK